jgi:hypothetical protein
MVQLGSYNCTQPYNLRNPGCGWMLKAMQSSFM